MNASARRAETNPRTARSSRSHGRTRSSYDGNHSQVAQMAAVTIQIPEALRQYCGGASALPVAAPNVRGALEALERHHPSVYRNVCDETGAVRHHLAVFVNLSHVRDRSGLDTALAPGDVVTILTAVSGG